MGAFWSAFAGSAAGKGVGSIGQYLGSMRLQKQGQGFASDMYGRRFQMMVNDLKAAGLNPMLAVNQGAGGGASSGTVGAGIDADMTAAYNQTRVASAQTALLKEQQIKTKKEGDVIGPKAVIMETIEDILKNFMGHSASEKKKKMSGILESIKKIKPSGVIKRPEGKLKWKGAK